MKNMEGLFLNVLLLFLSVMVAKEFGPMSSVFSEYYPHNLSNYFLLYVLLVVGKDVHIPNKLVFIFANEANYLYNATCTVFNQYYYYLG